MRSASAGWSSSGREDQLHLKMTTTQEQHLLSSNQWLIQNDAFKADPERLMLSIQPGTRPLNVNSFFYSQMLPKPPGHGRNPHQIRTRTIRSIAWWTFSHYSDQYPAMVPFIDDESSPSLRETTSSCLHSHHLRPALWLAGDGHAQPSSTGSSIITASGRGWADMMRETLLHRWWTSARKLFRLDRFYHYTYTNRESWSCRCIIVVIGYNKAYY